ncbi:MAG: DNA mismatch repair endonuclease MutL [Spirochaetes bacterium]|nr:DNA mismatch repair endonuclease MutL [Spirochaetota bacterium]
MARIHILPPETARLIAAGEVIERPASALRELIDNALDAGASEIRVELASGGIDLVQVSDDGAGMSKEDLALSVLEHATSKIETADDLLTARTLGFRGEALASIAAVARLEMTSVESGTEMGWRLRKDIGGNASLTPTAARRGTTVSARAFFENFPARRQFLKRPSSEAALCRTVFNEKAVAHPGTTFVWASGGSSERLPAGGRLERIAILYPDLPARALRSFSAKTDEAAFEVVYTDPSCHRRDRRYVQIFVNRRKVPEWGLAGVLEYAFYEYLPGGMHPIAFLFAEIDPARADFNIHPAKREVRIKRLDELKNAFLTAFRTHLRVELGAGPTDMAPFLSERQLPGISGYSHGFTPLVGAMSQPAEARERFDPQAWEMPGEERPAFSSLGKPDSPAFRYLGRAFGPFLLFEKDDVLYILDQHAAHERILFDELSNETKSSQELLVPAVFDCPPGSARTRLSKSLCELSKMGYAIELTAESCVVNAVPSFLGEKAVQALAETFSNDGTNELPGFGLMATMACRAAITDGDELDPAAARDLVARALELPLPRCPHGRPIWVKLDRTSLDRMVGRLVQ